MAGITTTSFGLPTAAAATSTSTVEQPGLLVQGDGGSTTLPAASATDFSGTNPTPLDQPHPTYSSLIQSHVAVLQAIGTPEAVIAQLNASQPQAEYMDRYIQGEIMQNPEGWDAYVGNPSGTARAGLQQLMPSVQLPAPGAGNAGYLPDGSPVSGIQVPGLSTPLLDPTTGAPQASGGGGMAMGVLGAAAAVGIGFLGWKFLKNRNAGADAAKTAAAAFGGGAGAMGAAGVPGAGSGLGALRSMGEQLIGAGTKADDLGAVHKGISLALLGGGGAAGTLADGTEAAASAWGVMNGLAPGNGYVQSLKAASVFSGSPMHQVHQMVQDHEWMGVIRQLANNGGTLADVAAAGIVSSQALGRGAGAAGGASAQHLAGLQQLFAGAANALA